MKRPRVPHGGYDIGFGKPPLHSRFKKGQSGNPNGRPKKTRPDLRKLMEDEMYQPIDFRIGGETRSAPAAIVMFKTAIRRACAGHARDLNFALKMMSMAGLLSPESSEKDGTDESRISASDKQILRELLRESDGKPDPDEDPSDSGEPEKET